MRERGAFITRWKEPAERAARKLLLYRQAEFWLRRLDPTWSLEEIRAEVVRIDDEAPGVKTFALRPNAHWRGFSAGQHAALEAEIDGARVRRVFSISSAPSDPLVALTVKRMPGGRVTPWLHDTVRPGHVLQLGPAAGTFVLPEPRPAQLLFISGGSGITPIMSILRELAARDAVSDVVLVHCARAADGIIFGRELGAIASRHPGLRLIPWFTDAGAHGPFDEARLSELVPDCRERCTFLCGPPGLTERVEQMWGRAGADKGLFEESFGRAPRERPRGATDAAGSGYRVHLARSERTYFLPRAENLLEGLERSGEHPPSGCHVGICQTCRCRKRHGCVANIITGSLSGDGDEEIQLCMSAPRSNIELEL